MRQRRSTYTPPIFHQLRLQGFITASHSIQSFQYIRNSYILFLQSFTQSLSASNSTSSRLIFRQLFISIFQIPLRALANSFSTLLGAVLAALQRAVVLIQSWIRGIAASFSIIAISIYQYAPITLQRHLFQTFYSGLSRLFTSVPLLSYTPYTQALYSITSQTVAVYRRREQRINRPYIDMVILNITLKATKPLLTAFLIYSFYQSLGST